MRPSRRSCAASLELAHTTWREAVARTQRRIARVVHWRWSPPVTYARIPRSARLSRAFLRVTKGSNPRDGLSKAITPSPRGAQRSSPNDSRKGSNSRALTALLESWVNDSRDSASLGKCHRDANKAPRGAGEQQTNRARREGVSRCSHLPLGSLRRFQASSNTYPNGLTPRQQTAALWRLCTTSTKGKEACAGNQSFARNEPRVTTASQGLIRRLSNWRRCLKRSRRWMHCRSLRRHRPAEGGADARLEL